MLYMFPVIIGCGSAGAGFEATAEVTVDAGLDARVTVGSGGRPTVDAAAHAGASTGGRRVVGAGGAGVSTSRCGDGVLDRNEQCDGMNFGPFTCATVNVNSCTSGFLTCTPQCQFDVTTCCVGARDH